MVVEVGHLEIDNGLVILVLGVFINSDQALVDLVLTLLAHSALHGLIGELVHILHQRSHLQQRLS